MPDLTMQHFIWHPGEEKLFQMEEACRFRARPSTIGFDRPVVETDVACYHSENDYEPWNLGIPWALAHIPHIKASYPWYWELAATTDREDDYEMPCALGRILHIQGSYAYYEKLDAMTIGDQKRFSPRHSYNVFSQLSAGLASLRLRFHGPQSALSSSGP